MLSPWHRLGCCLTPLPRALRGFADVYDLAKSGVVNPTPAVALDFGSRSAQVDFKSARAFPATALSTRRASPARWHSSRAMTGAASRA